MTLIDKKRELETIRYSLAVLHWYYIDMSIQIEQPGSIITLSRAALRRDGRISVGSVYTDSGHTYTIDSDPVTAILVRNVRKRYSTFANTGLIGTRVCVSEPPDEAALDKAFRVMLPFYPPPDQMPVGRFIFELAAPAVVSKTWQFRTDDGRSVDELRKETLKQFDTASLYFSNPDVDRAKVFIRKERILEYIHPSKFLI